MNKVLLISALVTAGSAAAWLGGVDRLLSDVSGFRSAEPQIDPATSPTDTETTSSRIARVIRGIGYVEPVSELRRLVFKVDGVIEAVHVRVGQRVETDTPLVTLRNQVEQANLAEKQQLVAVAAAEREQLLAGIHPDQIEAGRRNLDVLREQLRYATKHLQRTEELARKKASTEHDYDKAETEVRRIERELRQGQSQLAHLEQHVREQDKQVVLAKLQLAEAQVALARQQLDQTILRAPFSGRILEILKREGEGARLIDREPVLVFADESHLRVRAEIDERYVHHLAEGQTAEVYGRGLGDERYAGKVVMVKRLMGNKTVFSHEASERKDLDVIQVLIDLPSEFQAPVGLQVDVALTFTDDDLP